MSGVALENEMYIFGGYDKDSEPCNDCFKFNLGTRRGEREMGHTRLDCLVSPLHPTNIILALAGPLCLTSGYH